MLEQQWWCSSAPRDTAPSSVVGSSALCPPPPRFQSAEGVRSAWAVASGPFGRTPTLRGRSAAQKGGIRYERKVQSALAAEYGRHFLPSAWFQFLTKESDLRRWCQLDGLVRHRDQAGDESVVLFEVKTHFTSDAWWQLRKLYEPVVRAAFSPKHVVLVVICKHFDPSVAFPESYELVDKDPAPFLKGAVTPEGRWFTGAIRVLPWRL